MSNQYLWKTRFEFVLLLLFGFSSINRIAVAEGLLLGGLGTNPDIYLNTVSAYFNSYISEQ